MASISHGVDAGQARDTRTPVASSRPEPDYANGMPQTTRRPVAVDLFAGAGGLSLGLEQAGFDVVASVEYDPVHATTHAFNFPLSEVLCADVSHLSVDVLKEAVHQGCASHNPDQEWDGEIDLVAGGPPCQGFSWIGKRQVDDARNDLIFHFFRLVEGLNPRYFIMENVPGIQAGEHTTLIADLVARFERAGYVVPPAQIVNAAYYGVPQDRRRYILMGYRQDVAPVTHPTPRTKPVRPVRSTMKPPAVFTADGPSVGDAVLDLPDLDSFEGLGFSDKVKLTTSTRRAMEKAASPYARKLAGIDEDPSDLSHPRVWDRAWLTSSAQTQHTAVSVERFSKTEPGSTESISRFLRLDPNGLCNTLRAGTGSERGAHTSPRPIHPKRARVLSVREAARLHSFPDWFRLHSTKWHGFRQIGNAVPPLLGRALGQEVVKALGLSPAKPMEAIELGEESLLHLAMTQATAVSGADRKYVPKQRRRAKDDLAVASGF